MSQVLGVPWWPLLSPSPRSRPLPHCRCLRRRTKPPRHRRPAPARVFFINPVQSTGNQRPDRPQGRRRAPVRAWPTRRVTLTDLDGSGYLVGNWANVRSETGDPAYSRRRAVPLQPPRRPVRAGDGLLLGHRGAEVHPGPRLRHAASCLRSTGVPGPPDQPDGGRQLLLLGQERRDPARQGRCRRRRGRRGDRARVRPRRARLPGRRASAARSRPARSARRSATTSR